MPIAYIGDPTTPSVAGVDIAANDIVLRPVSVRGACSLQGIGFTGGATSGTARWRGVLYSAHPSTGEPATLLGTTAESTGVTVNVHNTAAFAAPVALTPGTYWLGVHVAVATSAGRLVGNWNANLQLVGQTYAAGAPSVWPGGHTTPNRDRLFFGYYESDGTLDAYTFGRMATGATSLTVIANRVTASRFTLMEAADVSHLTTRFDGDGSITTKYRGVIYAVAGGVPGALIAATNECVGAWRNEWIRMPFSSPVSLAAGDYYLGLHPGTSLSQSSDTAGTNRATLDTYADGPANPWGTPAANPTVELVIYASYTPGGTPPVATPRVIQPVWIMG